MSFVQRTQGCAQARFNFRWHIYWGNPIVCLATTTTTTNKERNNKVCAAYQWANIIE